jgi:hypothetical protein
VAEAAAFNAQAALQALAERGAPVHDALRWHHLQALQRRAAALTGAARQLVDERLAAQAAASAQALDAWEAQQALAAQREPVSQGHTGPLAALSAHLATLAAQQPAAPRPEPKALRQFRGQWTQLHVEQRLARVLAQVPRQAGPLNSQGLVVRAIEQLRALSPAYLQQFILHADALMGLEALLQAAAVAPGTAASPSAAPARPTARRGRTASPPSSAGPAR